MILRLSEHLETTAKTADERMCALDFQAGLEAVFDFVKAVNGYVTEQQPWVLAKDPERAHDLDRVL